MNLEYDRLIGQKLTSLESWRGLCMEVGVESGGQLQSIKKCKEVCFIVPLPWKRLVLTIVGPVKGLCEYGRSTRGSSGRKKGEDVQESWEIEKLYPADREVF